MSAHLFMFTFIVKRPYFFLKISSEVVTNFELKHSVILYLSAYNYHS